MLWTVETCWTNTHKKREILDVYVQHMYSLFTICIWCIASKYMWKYAENMREICSICYSNARYINSTYVIHSFSIWTFFQRLRSDVPKHMRNVKLVTSNLQRTYVKCMYNPDNVSQRMSNTLLICFHMVTVFSMHIFLGGRCVERHMRTYHLTQTYFSAV